VQASQLHKLHDLDLDLGSGRGHTGEHIWSSSTHTPNYIEIGKKLRRYGWMDTTEFSKSIRSSPGDDLKIGNAHF